MISRSKIHYLEENEPPSRKLVSAGDLLIKSLAEKQSKITTTLDEQLAVNQEFTKSTQCSALDGCSAGASSLKEFATCVKSHEKLRQLQTLGLSNDDIDLYFSTPAERIRNIEPSIRDAKLTEIESIIRNQNVSKADTGARSDQLTQNSSIKSNSVETKLFQFPLCNEKPQLIKPHAVIDHIKEIEQNTFGSLIKPIPSISKIRRKSRKLSRRLEHSIDFSTTQSTSSEITSTNSYVNVSKWDETEIVPETPKSKVRKTYSCSRNNFYTIKNGEIVKIDSDKVGKNDFAHDSKRLSEEEIVELPKFHNYQPGKPSKVLYLKNLGTRVDEKDLENVFQNYRQDIADINLLKGRMRGQAFVTFSSETKAEEAFKATNGIILRNRPLIIEFGKKS